MPFFSVVIPVYNRAGLIAETINSVLHQTFDDYELIVINDGSTDNSDLVIRELILNNSKVKYLSQGNSERGAARNSGFRNSSGAYVVFLDSDDLMHVEHLATLQAKIKEQNFPNFITTKYHLKTNNKITIPAALRYLKEGYYDINLLLKGSHFGCNIAVKRNNPGLHLFIEDRKYAIMEDWMFITQNLNHDKLYIIDRSTITMNDHEERSMRKHHDDIIRKRILATEWLENNISLTEQQKIILWGFSYEFCAIHSYIDGNRSNTFRYLSKAIRLTGIDMLKFLLFLKNIAGYRLIQRVKP